MEGRTGIINRAELWAQCSPTQQELKPVLAEALLSPSSSVRVQTLQFRDTHSWDFI